jgi:hypothetical protein
MPTFRQYTGNFLQGDASTHVTYAGNLVVDAAGNVFVHDGSTPGGNALHAATATNVKGSVGHDVANGGAILIAGGNTDGTAGAGGNVAITGGATLGDSTDQGGDVTIEGGGASFGHGGNVILASGDGPIHGNLLIYNLPTADPNVQGAVWSSNGTLMISAG